MPLGVGAVYRRVADDGFYCARCIIIRGAYRAVSSNVKTIALVCHHDMEYLDVLKDSDGRSEGTDANVRAYEAVAKTLKREKVSREAVRNVKRRRNEGL